MAVTFSSSSSTGTDLDLSGDLTVSGTTTTINTAVTTLVDPIIHLQTASGGGALASDTDKDVGLALQYHTGSAAKQAFLGWDDSAGKLTFIADASLSSEVVSGSVGTIVATFEGNLTGDVTGNVSGSAATTTGAAAVATEVTASANNTADETVYPTFVGGATGSQGIETDTGLTYNPNSGILTATAFAGDITGNVTGNASGTAASVTAGSQGNITTLAALTSLGAAGATTDIAAGDVTMYNAADNGNPTISLGSSSAERLVITTSYVSGGQLLEYVKFSTIEASSTANRGKYIFDVDGTDILTIDDGGIDIASGKTFAINGSDIATTDTTYTAGDGLTLTGTDFDLDGSLTTVTSILQAGLKVGRDAHNLVDFTTDDKLIFRVADVNEVELVADVLQPATNDGVALGTASLGWSDLHLATGGTIFATDLVLGEDAQTVIDFETANEIHFDADNAERVKIDSTGLNIVSGSLETATIDYTDGDLSMTIADGGKVTFAAGFAVGSDAAGDILYSNGTNYVRLGKGDDDQVLTLASGLPSWAAAGGGQSPYDAIVASSGGDYSDLQTAEDALDGGAAYKALVKQATYSETTWTIDTAGAHWVIEGGTTITGSIVLSANDATIEFGPGCTVSATLTISGSGCRVSMQNGFTAVQLVVSGHNNQIDGGGWDTQINGAASNVAVTISGNHNQVKNLKCSTTQGGAGALNAMNVSGYWNDVEAIYVTASGNDGIYVTGATCKVTSCRVTNLDANAIYSTATNNVWVNNLTWETDGIAYFLGSNCDDSVVVGNAAHITTGVPLNISSDSENCVVVGNRFDGSITDSDGTGVVASNDLT